MFDRKIFQLRLSELRQSNKLTVSQLANSLSVSMGLIGHWENGHRVPSIEALFALASYFCVSIDYLLGRNDDPQYEIYLAVAESSLLEGMPDDFLKLFNYAKENGLKKEMIGPSERWKLMRLFEEWKQINLEYEDYYNKLDEYSHMEERKHREKQLENDPLGLNLQPKVWGILETFKRDLLVKKPQIVSDMYADRSGADRERDASLEQDLRRLIGVKIGIDADFFHTPMPNQLADYLYALVTSDVKKIEEDYIKIIPD